MTNTNFQNSTFEIKLEEEFIGRGTWTLLELPTSGIKQINVVFLESNILTSEGVVDWISWLQTLNKLNNPPLHLFNCPVTVVRQFSSTVSFLPSHAVVESFYAPFFSEATSESKMILLRRGTDFGPGFLKIPECKDSNGNPMELDVISEIYFGFLG